MHTIVDVVDAIVADATAVVFATRAVGRPKVRTPAIPHALNLVMLSEPTVQRMTFLVAEWLAAARIVGKAAVTSRRNIDGLHGWKLHWNPIGERCEIAQKRFVITARGRERRFGSIADGRELVCRFVP